PKGRAPEDSLLAKLRAGLDRLPECKAFIKNFLRDANPLPACQKILKTKGLNRETYNECLAQLENIPRQSPVRAGLVAWLDKHLLTAAGLGLDNAGMPASSDSIESLFGVVKRHGTGETKDACRMALRIPALCGGAPTREDARNVLNVSVKEQEEITNSLPSLARQRRQVLPNPGSLDKILSGGAKPVLELLPGSKNRPIDLSRFGCPSIAPPKESYRFNTFRKFHSPGQDSSLHRQKLQVCRLAVKTHLPVLSAILALEPKGGSSSALVTMCNNEDSLTLSIPVISQTIPVYRSLELRLPSA
ncbi:MAG: hypothetical protein GY862_02295, partial [Gammaproteobacteria bacterium]|nr:hypothetical protein [Gammaproteobacteria bacterium]